MEQFGLNADGKPVKEIWLAMQFISASFSLSAVVAEQKDYCDMDSTIPLSSSFSIFYNCSLSLSEILHGEQLFQ